MTFEVTTSSNIETFDINTLTNKNNIATINIPTSAINEVQNYTPEINIKNIKKQIQ